MDIIRLTEPVAVETKHNDPPMVFIDSSGIKRKFPDIAYGNFPSRMLDLYLPEDGEGPFPTIVFFHGGAFWGGSRKDFQCIYALKGILRGYAVASVDYSLCDDALFPAGVQDCMAAVRYLRKHAAQYKLDPERIAVMGDSAGAYMAAMVAGAATNPALMEQDRENGDTPGNVQAMVGLFGVYYLTQQSYFTEEKRLSPDPLQPKLDNFADLFLGINCREHPNMAAMADPASYVTAEYPPALIQGGTEDEIVPYEASVNFAGRVNAVCGEGRAVLQSLEGARHGDDAYNSDENIDRIFAFLDKHLK